MQGERREGYILLPNGQVTDLPFEHILVASLSSNFSKNSLSLDWKKAEMVKGSQQNSEAAGISPQTRLLPSLEAKWNWAFFARSSLQHTLCKSRGIRSILWKS